VVESSRREWVSASVVAGLGRRHADGDADVVAVSWGRPVVDADLPVDPPVELGSTQAYALCNGSRSKTQ